MNDMCCTGRTPEFSDESGLPCGLCITKIEGLGVARGGLEILRDVNLEIHCGELTALIGPNGAGKSTLLRAILGEVRHTGKVAFLTNRSVPVKPPRIGYVPQRLELDAGSPTSVFDLIAASRSRAPVWLMKTRSAVHRVETILATVEAEHLIDRRLGTLSGGELQRVMLALALDPLPQLLLLDEPVSGVDSRGLAVFYEMVAGLRKRYDMSILLTSHDMGLVAKHADRVVFLDRTIVRSGTVQEVFADERVVEAFGEEVFGHLGMVSPN